MQRTQDTTTYEIVDLLPADIKTDTFFDVRPFSREFSSSEEDKRIEHLAEGMEKIGQLDDLIITPDHILIAGHRRRRACILINERRSIIGHSLFRLRCKIDASQASRNDLHQKAVQSNLQRENLSAMDLSYLIVKIREQYGWIGPIYTKQVAGYLNIDCATVTQHERLHRAPKALQNDVHSGKLSYLGALDILKLPKDQQAVVLEHAAKIQEEEDLDKTMNRFVKGRATLDQTAQSLITPKAPHIERKAVIKAIREQSSSPKKKTPLQRDELIEGIAKLDSPLYSKPGRAFARYCATVYAAGRGSWEDLAAKFRAISESYAEKVTKAS